MTSGALRARTWQLLDILADGDFHSGEVLAQHLGVSRASIFNALDGAADCGITVQRVRGRGYRLARAWQPLRRDEILGQLGGDAGLFDIEIVPEADSTNTSLLQRASLGAPGGSVVVAELQRAGRGRLGRTWHSGLGNALTFSLLWRFDRGLNALSGLSLAVGVAIVRALDQAGARGVGLKWPNDIVSEQGKLGGVLIEAQGDMLGPSAVVIGVGLNCHLPGALSKNIDQPACGLDELCAEMPERNRLLALLLRELAAVLRQFGQDGFAPFRGEWERRHLHRDKEIRLCLADGSAVDGIARGAGDGGELLLETVQGMRSFNSGEVGGRR
ncbi:MAG TPA: biotin--[acetyl-CoA-carboxylase] ligase [Gallionella sp.]|nr:biotin--[acetyl-CoA-carboxylase] ligase [Gallionella sp.]